jgi:ParB family chromosome partitioning protein
MKDTINIKDFLNKAKNMKNGISNNVEMNKLGRGLSALLSDNNDLINKNNIIEDKLKILKINILEIEINKNQPRKFFEDDSLKELSISIAQKGILQPILVRKNKNNLFEIIAGERRFRAAKIANLKEVPCIVLDYSDLEVLEIALIENLHRKDLNAIEEANSFKKLIEEYKHTHESLANILGKSRSHITNYLRLLNLSEKIQQLVINGSISAGHAKVVSLDPENADKMVEIILRDGLSVRDTEELLKNIRNKIEDVDVSFDDKIENNEDLIKELNLLEEKLSGLFDNLGVKIIPNKNGTGVLKLKYKKLSDIQQILESYKK